MKLLGKKIPKGNLLLFFSFTVISLCSLLIVSATRAEHDARLLGNSLYSGHQKVFSVIGSEEEDQWDYVMQEIEAEFEDFAVFVPVRNEDVMMRGIYVNGDVDEPPMLSGAYFDHSTSWTDQGMVVLGKDHEKDVSARDGKTYYQYHDMEYEVIGIMGTEEDSRINQMVLLDFKSAVRMSGINTQYILDAKKESRIQEVGQKVYDLFEFPANVLISLEHMDVMDGGEDGEPEGEADDGTGIASYLSSDVIMDTMYVMILISFALSTILITLIWFRFRRPLFYAWRLCGYDKRSVFFEISKRFYTAAGAGFMTGLVFMCLITNVVPEVRMGGMDVCGAFGMTLGLGTVILCVCYLVNLRVVHKLA